MKKLFSQGASWFNDSSMAASPGFQPASVHEDGSIRINIHPLTGQPTKAWDTLKVKQVHKKVQRMPLTAAVVPNKVRFVCVSDTHNRTNGMAPIPDGDVLLHAGDFTMVGNWQEVKAFDNWLGTLPHKHKIVIAGNHELTFDCSETNIKRGLLSKRLEKPKEFQTVRDVRELLTNCIYLEDTELKVCGLRVYGSPWQPEFGNWAYNLPRGADCLEKWNKIPEGIDVLMTHGPPIGHGDLTCQGVRAGCVELLHTVQHRVKPRYHVFGHIHEDPGITSDGSTKFINASSCTLRYQAANAPIIFDLDLPHGYTKADITFPVTGCHGYPLDNGEDKLTDSESMETDITENVDHSNCDSSRNDDKAENFTYYCEMADMSDSFHNMEMKFG